MTFAIDPARILPAAFVIGARGSAIAVADVAEDGIVHLRELSGSVASNAHRLSTLVT